MNFCDNKVSELMLVYLLDPILLILAIALFLLSRHLSKNVGFERVIKI